MSPWIWPEGLVVWFCVHLWSSVVAVTILQVILNKIDVSLNQHLSFKCFVWQIVKEKIWRIKCASDKFKVFFTDCNQIYLVMFMCLTVDTRFIFTKKNQMLQNVFLISVMLRWHSVIKNHKICTFKVNFLCQKTPESFYFFHWRISI